MASTVSENGGDSIEEVSQDADNAEPKLNGEINGSCEEPMDVDESPVLSVKKVNLSDVNCIEENNRTSNNKETNLSSETSVENMDTAISDEVPENGEATNSNGFAEDGEDQVDEDNVDDETNEEENQDENNLENSQEDDNNDEDATAAYDDADETAEADAEDVAGADVEDTAEADAEETAEADAEETAKVDAEDKQSEHEENDDDVVLMGEDSCKDPFSADINPSEHDTINATNDSSNQDGSDVEQIEEIDDKDPFASENEHVEDLSSDNKLDESKENERKEKSGDESKDDEKETSGEQGNNDSKDEEKMEEDEDNKNEETSEKKSEEDEKTPEKGKKKKDKVQQPLNITPRRSSRNVNKPKVYTDEPDIKPTSSSAKKSSSDDPDIEEVVPQDPLAMDSPVLDRKNKKAVVVNDPKRLVEIVSGNKPSKQGKKEPTLVIIDTNSILSGKGPIPVSPSPPMAHASSMGGSSRGSFSVLPMALPAQGMYPQGMRPPPLTQLKPIMSQPATPSPPPATPKPVILPSLTDDMYVVEAPSFIVPYVYEKPPIKPLKGFVEQVEQAIKEIKAHLEKEKEREEKAKEEKEKEEKEKEEKEKEEKEKEEGIVKVEKESSEVEEKDDNDKKEKDDECDKADDEKDENKDQTLKDKKKNDKEEEKMEVDSESKDDSVTEVKDDDKEGESKSSAGKPDKDKSSEKSTEEGEKKKSSSYFDNPLGKFFIQIGVNLVQEHVQTDLLRSQKRKKEREGKCTPEVQQAMNSLIRSLEYSKETNEPFKLDLKKCEYCSFKTESALVMAHHLETPHMRNYVYKCNFCSLEVRSPHDILYHMEAEHNVRGRLERAPAFHQCPSCPFEDNQKGKLSRHLLSCAKKYRPERNQEPPLDFEPPAKIPRVSRTRPAMSPGNAVYQAAMSGLKQGSGHPLLPKLVPAPNPAGLIRGRGRPQMINRYLGDMRSTSTLAAQQKALAAQMRPGMLYRPSGSNSQPPVLLPASYQIQGSQLYQNAAAVAAASAASKASAAAVGSSTAKLLQQPSISITPLPRQAPTPSNPVPQQANKPGRPAGSSNSKATFVICEICDGYIKDLEQLRNHMQWIHKVKIHPKMIYNRPPLNCQKCQFRFFTDQGLERHLLGSHGLVTSSMQEAANKGKDGGRCPVCGRVYQWKLLNHVARDHSMSLKPAHLSYKCTVCTATFGMYKQFENHVYSAHSVVAKRVMDKKPSTSSSQASTSSQGDMLKPLKINDEITIIPQPARSKTKPVASNSSNRNTQKKV